MAMNRNGIITNLSIKVGDVEIETANCVKLLGMYIDCHLKLSYHVQALVSKCSKQINAIARLSRVLDTNAKICIMNAFILYNFQFCAAVYHHCNVNDARRLEKLQKHVLKYVYNNFKASFVELLQIAGKKSLFAVRQAILVESVFKVLHNTMPSMSSHLFECMIL